MGFFSLIKKLFSKNIQCKSDMENDLIYLFPSRSRTVHIGYNIIVKSGFKAVFVVRDKVTDVLNEGKYRLDWLTLSNTARKLKIEKLDNAPNSFRADIYFVNTKLFNQMVFESNQPFIFKTANFGRVVANSGGICSYQISDASAFISVLLRDRAYIKNKTAMKLISYYIGNEINNQLENGKVSFDEIITSPKSINTLLNECMFEALLFAGIRVTNIVMASIQCVSKHQQNKINEFLAYQSELKENSSLNMPQCTTVNVNSQFEINGLDNESDESTSSVSYVNVGTGNEIGGAKICPHCKATVVGNFCNNCGAKLF